MRHGLVDRVEVVERAAQPLDEQEDERDARSRRRRPGPASWSAGAAAAARPGPANLGRRRAGRRARLGGGAGHDRSPRAGAPSASVAGVRHPQRPLPAPAAQDQADGVDEQGGQRDGVAGVDVAHGAPPPGLGAWPTGRRRRARCPRSSARPATPRAPGRPPRPAAPPPGSARRAARRRPARRRRSRAGTSTTWTAEAWIWKPGSMNVPPWCSVFHQSTEKCTIGMSMAMSSAATAQRRARTAGPPARGAEPGSRSRAAAAARSRSAGRPRSTRRPRRAGPRASRSPASARRTPRRPRPRTPASRSQKNERVRGHR